MDKYKNAKMFTNSKLNNSLTNITSCAISASNAERNKENALKSLQTFLLGQATRCSWRRSLTCDFSPSTTDRSLVRYMTRCSLFCVSSGSRQSFCQSATIYQHLTVKIAPGNPQKRRNRSTHSAEHAILLPKNVMQISSVKPGKQQKIISKTKDSVHTRTMFFCLIQGRNKRNPTPKQWNAAGGINRARHERKLRTVHPGNNKIH